MSMPIASGNEGFPNSPESEALLKSIREGILHSTQEKFDDAVMQEQIDGRIYLQEAPVATPFDDVIALTLTRDGVRPFLEEAETKEQLILYFTSDFEEMILIEHIRDGSHEKFILDMYSFSPVMEAEDLLQPENDLEPTADDFTIVDAQEPISDVARMSALREKINRFLITPQD